jgi:hypothetical protein
MLKKLLKQYMAMDKGNAYIVGYGDAVRGRGLL